MILAIHRVKGTPSEARRHLWTKYGWYVMIVNAFLAAIFSGSPVFPLLMGLVVCQGFREFFHPLSCQDPGFPATLGTSLGLAIFLSALFLAPETFWPTAVAVMFLALVYPVLARKPESAFREGGTLLVALFVIGILASHTLFILKAPKGSFSLAYLYILVAMNDGFAELCGRGWGRRPLLPGISPNKTVGGALGGFLSAAAGSLWFAFLMNPLPLYLCLGAGVLVAVAGQLGDLLFSALKRDLGLKDFGSLFPGHGGVLDRFDSLLGAAPVFFLFLKWIS